MGFKLGSLFSGKDVIEVEATPGKSSFEGKYVAVEGHALQYKTIASLDSVYKAGLAAHQHLGTPLPAANFNFSNRHARAIANESGR
jgi:hypothetical protein